MGSVVLCHDFAAESSPRLTIIEEESCTKKYSFFLICPLQQIPFIMWECRSLIKLNKHGKRVLIRLPPIPSYHHYIIVLFTMQVEYC